MSSSRICVAVRKRPPADSSEKDIVETQSPSCVVNEPKIKYDLTPYTDRHIFTYDQVFAETDNNAAVYERCCLPLIDTVFSYGNATCFAYGQTGSGKTYTMLGSSREPGLYAIAAKEILTRAKKIGAEIFVSFYEIYGRKIFDLLNHKERLFAREDGDKVINICGLSEHPVSDIEEVFDVITEGSAERASGQTSANSESSRSHAVLQLEVRESRETATGRGGPKLIGRISFIDLAGNERGADTFDCDRKTRMEGAEINKSLLALKECIRALGMGKSHVPFRGSILTEVLRDSFTGNSRTTMIATISPTATHCVNTLNTLRYTQRVKDLGGGSGGGARVEQVMNAPGNNNRARPFAPRRRTSEAVKNRPEWVADFVEDSGEEVPSGTPTPPSGAGPTPPSGAQGYHGGAGANGRRLSPVPVPKKKKVGKKQVRVKDPKIATIVQAHIAALDERSDDDEDEDALSETPTPAMDADGGGDEAAAGRRSMPREEERQVRKVHAYVVEEIAKAEEKLVALHRRHIDAKMTGIKEEIRAIQSFEESDSVDEYVSKVRTLLQKQMTDMNQIMEMLTSISGMLKDEEDLSNTLTASIKNR